MSRDLGGTDPAPLEDWEFEVANEMEAFLRELCLRRGLRADQVYEALVRAVRSTKSGVTQ